MPGLDPIVILDAILGTPENLDYWRDELLNYASSTAPPPQTKREKPHVIPVDLPDRLDPIAATRAKALLRHSFGDLEKAKDVLERLAQLAGALDETAPDGITNQGTRTGRSGRTTRTTTPRRRLHRSRGGDEPMRGYTAKKGNRYYAVIYEGVDPATGKERRRWYAAGPRKSDAEKLVTELVKRCNDGDYRVPEKITLGAYLTEKWLPVQRSQLKASTFDSYRRTIELHVLPTIGPVMLSRLLPEDLEGLYARLLESGRRNGKGGGLSPTSVRYVHRILRKALNEAFRKGTIAKNPAALADPPRGAGPGAGHEARRAGPPRS